MFLHCRKAHWKAVSEPGNGEFPLECQPHDVASGGIGEGVEQEVDFEFGEVLLPDIYNHMVVDYRFRRALQIPWNNNRSRYVTIYR